MAVNSLATELFLGIHALKTGLLGGLLKKSLQVSESLYCIALFTQMSQLKGYTEKCIFYDFLKKVCFFNFGKTFDK